MLLYLLCTAFVFIAIIASSPCVAFEFIVIGYHILYMWCTTVAAVIEYTLKMLNLNPSHFSCTISSDPLLLHFMKKWLFESIFNVLFVCMIHAIRVTVLQVLGTGDLYDYLEKYGLQLDPQLERLVGRSLFWSSDNLVDYHDLYFG